MCARVGAAERSVPQGIARLAVHIHRGLFRRGRAEFPRRSIAKGLGVCVGGYAPTAASSSPLVVGSRVLSVAATAAQSRASADTRCSWAE
jgi:hypothetical protein